MPPAPPAATTLLPNAEAMDVTSTSSCHTALTVLLTQTLVVGSYDPEEVVEEGVTTPLIVQATRTSSSTPGSALMSTDDALMTLATLAITSAVHAMGRGSPSIQTTAPTHLQCHNAPATSARAKRGHPTAC